MNKIFIISIGSKARQGKDTTANFIKELRSTHEVHILHWADSLYDEVRNLDRQWPLIKKIIIGNSVYYTLLHTPYSRNYMLYKAEEIPGIHTLMKERKIDEYWGMDDKDAPILQLWGTEFRRQKFDELYWVNKTYNKVLQIINDFNTKNTNSNLYICIPDTRFKNEYNNIKYQRLTSTKWKGIFIRVVRLNDDGTQYIDPSRDPNHPSEAELDDTLADFTLEAKSGDLETLKQKTTEFLNEIDTNC